MTNAARIAERIWFGEDAMAQMARVALAPAALAYGGVIRARGALYDAGVLATHAVKLPVLSVGNITVGGTGKTPVSSWIAARLRADGARPAIVLRGYGDDEPRVHALLSPDVPVVIAADRVRGVRDAADQGADVVVLDDAFQHRRAARDVDVVLVAAERASSAVKLLPAGPYREPLSALRRASLVIVTRKSASIDEAMGAIQTIERAAPQVPVARVALMLDELRAWSDDANGRRVALGAIDGERVLGIAAIGDPRAFFAQLEALGTIVRGVPFADHHAFSMADATALARDAEGVDRVVCTLKDAVKLGPLWPRLAPPLWYVSQRVALEQGGDVLDVLIARLLAARTR